jgi:hypothetical protein
MSDRSNLLSAVVTRLNTVANIGTVHAYQRYSSKWDDFLGQFATTVLGTRQTRGWIVTLAPTNPVVGTASEQDAAFGQIARVYTIKIVGMIGLKDSSNTEGLIGDLVEAVMDALDNQIDLGGTANVLRYGVGPSSWVVNDVRQFGSVVCNYVEVDLPVIVHKSEVYA